MNNSVDIEVNLTGAEQAKKGLVGIGETAANMADRFELTNSHLGEGLESIVGNVGEARGAFKDLGSSIKTMGKSGQFSFLGLLGPIGAVVAAGYGLYETFINISGAAQKAEESQEAFGAAAADLQSKLEALAEKGVIPSINSIKEFTRLNLLAQLSKEKVETATKAVSKALEKETNARKHSLEIIRKQGQAVYNLLEGLGVEDSQRQAMIKHHKAEAETRKKLAELAVVQREAQEELAASEKKYIEMEETAPERLQTRIKESAARLKSLEISEAESKYQADVLDMQKVDIEQEEHRINLQAERAKGDAEALQAILKDIDARVKRRNAEEIAEKRFEAQRRAIEQKRRDDQKKIAADNQRRADARRARALLKAKQHQNELFQIRSLEIAQMQQNGVKARKIIEARYQLELDQAGKNANLKKMATIRNEMAITQLTISEREKREADEKQRRDRQLNFMLETQAFNINQMESGIDQELAMLDLKYKKERLLKQHSESEITELTRRANIERLAILDRAAQQQLEEFQSLTLDMFSNLGQGVTSAVYSSFVDNSFAESKAELNRRFNEQITTEREALADSLKEFEGSQAERVETTREANDKLLKIEKEYQKAKRDIERQEKSALPQAIGEVLIALGEQALIESLMFGAKALAAAYLPGGQKAAAGYAAASVAMLGAAAMAGVSGKALKASGGGGGAGSKAPSFSPLDSPLEANTPQREQAESTSTVYNINFGGAVIYDSRQAAEMAFADRLTEIQNMRRRGAPRRSRNAV